MRIGRGLLGVLGLVVALGFLGAAYESVAEAADARAYPPPGQMVDVGGYRLHIKCIGMGGPTVVIDAGWGDSFAAWSSWVQPSAASTTRVCTYDRAGMGYSEPGPFRALPTVSLPNCTRCWRTQMSRGRMCWWATPWAA